MNIKNTKHNIVNMVTAKEINQINETLKKPSCQRRQGNTKTRASSIKKQLKKQINIKLKEEIRLNRYKNIELKKQLKEQKQELLTQINEHPKYILEKLKRENID